MKDPDWCLLRDVQISDSAEYRVKFLLCNGILDPDQTHIRFLLGRNRSLKLLKVLLCRYLHLESADFFRIRIGHLTHLRQSLVACQALTWIDELHYERTSMA